MKAQSWYRKLGSSQLDSDLLHNVPQATVPLWAWQLANKSDIIDLLSEFNLMALGPDKACEPFCSHLLFKEREK